MKTLFLLSALTFLNSPFGYTDPGHLQRAFRPLFFQASPASQVNSLISSQCHHLRIVTVQAENSRARIAASVIRYAYQLSSATTPRALTRQELNYIASELNRRSELYCPQQAAIVSLMSSDSEQRLSIELPAPSQTILEIERRIISATEIFSVDPITGQIVTQFHSQFVELVNHAIPGVEDAVEKLKTAIRQQYPELFSQNHRTADDHSLSPAQREVQMDAGTTQGEPMDASVIDPQPVDTQPSPSPTLTPASPSQQESLGQSTILSSCQTKVSRTDAPSCENVGAKRRSFYHEFSDCLLATGAFHRNSHRNTIHYGQLSRVLSPSSGSTFLEKGLARIVANLRSTACACADATHQWLQDGTAPAWSLGGPVGHSSSRYQCSSYPIIE